MTLEFIHYPLIESLKITLLVSVMMLIIDVFNVRLKGRLSRILSSSGVGRQYIVSNIFGVL